MQHLYATAAHVPRAFATMPAPEAQVDTLEVRQELLRLLASEQFSKAQRMSRLIKFLVEAELGGNTAQLTEYAVGIDVFGRDARTYSTCEDPIVRVQMGRLRDRLKTYYGQSGAASSLRFTVPLRSYRPLITRNMPAHDEHSGKKLLAIVPLLSCGQGESSLAFTSGLNEELSHRLFNAFSHQVVPHPFVASGPGKTCGVTHLLEGSVRTSGATTRISMRLIDISAGFITWSEQFDHEGRSDIAAQEDLANTICCALRHYFDEE